MGGLSKLSSLALLANVCAFSAAPENVLLGIMDGTVVSSADYPFVVKITTPSGGYCTGMLIHTRYVLTSAHCVDKKDAGGNAYDWETGLGGADGTPDGTVDVFIQHVGIWVNDISTVWVFPGWEGAGEAQYDLALIFLHYSGIDPEWVIGITWARNEVYSSDRKNNIMVAGFGLYSCSEYSDGQLRMGTFKFDKVKYGQNFSPAGATVLYVRPAQSKTGSGDSGAPVFWETGSDCPSGRKYELLGVHSRSTTCSNPDNVYSMSASFVYRDSGLRGWLCSNQEHDLSDELSTWCSGPFDPCSPFPSR